MSEGDALLLTVLRVGTKDRTAANALADWLQDHLPGNGQFVALEARLRVRWGTINLELASQMNDIGQTNIRIVTEHWRGKKLTSRIAVKILDLASPHLGTAIRETLTVFRS